MGEPMDRSGRIFSTSGTFEQLFPTVEEAVVVFAEFEYGAKRREGMFDVRSRGGLMRCGNPRCFRGGYEFDYKIGDMVRENATERQVSISCPGDEGTPKRTRGRSCAFSVECTISLKYKSQSSAPKKPSEVL